MLVVVHDDGARDGGGGGKVRDIYLLSYFVEGLSLDFFRSDGFSL